MTIEQARSEIVDMERFSKICCNNCRSEGYCPDDCEGLERAKKIDFEEIVGAYARYDGDLSKVKYFIGKKTLNQGE